MDADWNLVSFEQAPAHEEYANYPLGREYMMQGAKVPGFVQGSLNGGFLKIAQSMSLQITGGSTAVRFTGQGGMRIAGAAVRQMLIRAAADLWDVPAQVNCERKNRIYIMMAVVGLHRFLILPRLPVNWTRPCSQN